MDLSKLSNEDLQALRGGDLSKVSAAGLLALRQQPQAEPPKQALGDDPGFWGTLPVAAGKTFDNVLNGMTQIYLGARGESSAQRGLAENVAEKERTYAPLKEARPWATGIGEALPALALPAGGGATLGAKVARSALAGGALGALGYGDVQTRGARALIGAAAGGAAPILGAAITTGKSLLEPLYNAGRETIAGRVLNRSAGPAALDVEKRLSSAQELVPGSSPTAGQVAESGGIAALERSAAARNPEAYSQRAQEQAHARLQALRGIAGDEASMTAAEGARDAATKALYSQADAGVAPLDGFFTGLMRRPQFQAAIQQAQQLAKNEGLEDIFFRGPNGEPVALLGQGAHYVKKALDDAMQPGAGGLGRNAAGAAGETQRAFMGWLEQHIPEYGMAKATFAEKSIPINRMQIGQELVSKLQTPLGDHGALGRESAALYARALRDADATAARATGFPGAKMGNVLSPEQLALVEGIAKDLARKANAQDLGRGVGSDTFQKIAMQNIAEQSGAPRWVGGLLGAPGVSRATGWAYQSADEKMQALIAEALLNPKRAAELMARARTAGLLGSTPQVRGLLQGAAARSGLLGAPTLQDAITN